MLDSKTIKKISDFVYVKPRTIQEVSFHIGKNWRTADAYVERIIKEQGILAVRIFREGTRGALKIVFWNNIEKIHSSDFQERLFKRIETARDKNDFSPFEIYQYVPENKRTAFLEEQSEYTVTSKQNLVNLLRTTENQLIIFSGNLSWVHVSQDKVHIMDIFEELAEKNISIKILCKIDIDSIENIEKVLEINHKLKKEIIEIRHCEQPFRAIIVDNKLVRFKEIRYPEKSSTKKTTYIFYDILDTEWIEWIQKVFWNLFRTSIKAEKRINDIKSIEHMK